MGLIISATRNPFRRRADVPELYCHITQTPDHVHRVTLERTRIMIDRTLKHYRVAVQGRFRNY